MSSKGGDRPIGRHDSPRNRPIMAYVLVGAAFLEGVAEIVFSILVVIYLAQTASISITSLGAGLGIGILVGLLLGVRCASLSDRVSARTALGWSVAGMAGCWITIVSLPSLWVFIVGTILSNILTRIAYGARGKLMTSSLGFSSPGVLRARMRSSAHVGFCVGTLLAGLATAWPGTLRIAIFTASAFQLASAVAILRTGSADLMPRGAGVKPRNGSMLTADWVLVFSLGLIQTPIAVQERWIQLQSASDHGALPSWTYAVVIALNALLTLALQETVATKIEARGVRRMLVVVPMSVQAGLLLLLPAILGLATGPVFATALLVGVSTLAECVLVAVSWELLYSVAPSSATAQYMGLYGVAVTVAASVAAPIAGVTISAPGTMWACAFICVAGAGAVATMCARRGLTGSRGEEPLGA